MAYAKHVFILIFIFAIVNSQQESFLSSELVETYKHFTKKSALSRIGDYMIENDVPLINQCYIDLWTWATSPKKLWAWKMSDAGAKLQSGILVFNIKNMGQFDECISIDHQESNSSNYHIKGKYCMANFVQSTSNTSILNSPNTAFMINSPMIDETIKNLITAFSFAICFPHSCKGEQLEPILNVFLSNSSIKIAVPDNDCSTKDPPEWTAASISAVTFFSLMGLIILLSTLYDMAKSDSTKSKYHDLLIAFSLSTNTARLLKTNKSSGSLRCLHGIRVLSMLWVLMGHRYSLAVLFPQSNLMNAVEWSGKWHAMMIIGASVSVDTFFVLSGLLLCYVFFTQHHNKSSFNLPLFYFHRFLRLWPAMSAMILFSTALFRFLGNGPFCPSLSNYFEKVCSDNWWSSLLYLQNYINPDDQCQDHLWYLAIDMQLYILSPLLLYPLLRNTRIGAIIIGLLTCASQIIVIAIVYTHNWAASIGEAKDQESYIRQYYVATHMRATPWLLGFIAGYALYKTRDVWKNKVNKRTSRIATLTAVLGWGLALAIMGAVVFGIKEMVNLSHVANHAQDGTFNAFARTGWSLAVLWVAFACIFGYGGPINTFLSWRMWEVLGRLAYSMYLLHPTLQYIQSCSLRSSNDFIQLNLVHKFFGDIILTGLAAYIWAMAFESPFMVIEKTLFSKKQVAKEKEDILPSSNSPEIMISSREILPNNQENNKILG